jgi:methyltransferase family protein
MLRGVAPPTLRSLTTTGPWRQRLRWIVRAITPWGIEWWLSQGNARRWRRSLKARLNSTAPAPGSRYEEAVRFLTRRGLDEFHVREGSMPEPTLNFVGDLLAARLPRDRPVAGLHVGNFLGLSLAYFSWLLGEHDAQSLMVSIDPNVTHRGIESPLDHAYALLGHFDQLSRNVIVVGYSLERGEPANEREHLESLAPEHVLRAFSSLGLTFDVVIVDGNHERNYVAREIAAVREVLAPAGLVVLDDINDWPGVKDIFARMRGDESWVVLGENGRAAVVQARNDQGQIAQPGRRASGGARIHP